MYTSDNFNLVLLLYIILWSEQKCIAGIIMKCRTVYCLINTCSCFVLILKFHIFSTVTHNGRWKGVVIVWRVATLPMSCYIVRNINTRSVPQLRRLCKDMICGKDVAAVFGAVIRFHGNSNLYT
jgi:hypothetical protein